MDRTTLLEPRRQGLADQRVAEASVKCATPAIAGHRAGLLAVLLAGLLAAMPGLWHERITGLDQAHHIASSIFFYDALQDWPVTHPVRYTLDYYRQYPALGFAFWPPVFHAAAGVVMLATGPGVFGSRLTLALFTMLLAGSFYLCVRRGCGPVTSVLATVVMLTVPVMVELENSVMLEVPMAAMTCLTLVAYFRLVDRGAWTSWGEMLLASLLCAGIVYTKQPGVFLLPALLLDLAWNHRHLLRDRRTWGLLALVVLWCVPLALFTLKFGRVNLEQSFGNAGNIYVASHKVADRWSVAGWTYYVREVTTQVSWLLCGLAAVGAIVLTRDAELRRRQGVWVLYVACWYLLFTLFDNKQPRFVSAVVPGLVALAVGLLAWCGRRWNRITWIGPLALLGLALWQGGTARAHLLPGYAGLRELTADLVQPRLDGNLVFFGGDYQLFVPWVRLLDETHQVHVLKGDDLLAASGSLAAALHDYRGRYVLVDAHTAAGDLFRTAVGRELPATLEHRGRCAFDDGGKAFEVDVYAYQGPLASSMARVPLRSGVHNVSAD